MALHRTARSMLPLSSGTDLSSPLGYSDGTKFSRYGEPPAVPAWRSASYGLSNAGAAVPSTYDLFNDGAWRDAERDADGDGLANWLEAARGPSTNDWWKSWFASKHFEPSVEPWKSKEYCGYRFGHFDGRPFADFDMADRDVDGDSLLDGEDDQDNDDVINIVRALRDPVRPGRQRPAGVLRLGRRCRAHHQHGWRDRSGQRDEPVRAESGLPHVPGLRSL